MRLISPSPWQHLTKLVKASPSKCHVAVAYFGNNGSRLLPLIKGSTLVVDMSEAAVKAGQTCPAEIGKLLRRGVGIFCCQGLHAKVFVVGKRALVGSTNASNRSENHLIEALLETDDASVVDQCREFIQNTRREFGFPVGPDYVERMEKLYQPPRLAGRPSATRVGLVPLEECDWEAADEEAQRAVIREARESRKLQRGFKYDTVHSDGRGFPSRLKRNDQIIQVLTGEDGGVLVYPPVAFIRCGEEYRVGNKNRTPVCMEVPKSLEVRSAAEVEEQSGLGRRSVAELSGPRLLGQLEKDRLMQIWD